MPPTARLRYEGKRLVGEFCGIFGERGRTAPPERRASTSSASPGGLAGRCPAVRFVPASPSNSAPLIQQVNITAGHIICGLVEERLFPRTRI
jgi:hypothetical protein